MRGLAYIWIVVFAGACGGGAGTAGESRAAEPRTGADIYAMQCTLCHGRDGRLGVSGAKDLTLSTLTREEMIHVVTEGRGLMMPYGRLLKPAEIEAVVDHVRTMKGTSS